MKNEYFLLINHYQELMKGQEKTAKGITLKEYINTTNMRRAAISRTKSKDKQKLRKSMNTSTNIPQKEGKDWYLQLTSYELAEEIKLKLAQLIPSYKDLIPLLNMFERLIDLFQAQINHHMKQNQITASILSDYQKLPIRSKISQLLKETKAFQNKTKILPENRNHITQYARQEKLDQSFLNIDDSRLCSESCSSLDVPNINFLLVTKKEQSPRNINQLQTKATINNQFNSDKTSFRSSLIHKTSLYQKLENDDKKKKCLIGANTNQLNPYPQSTPVSCRNSQINISSISSCWNNMTQTQNRLAKFQEYKMKSRS